MKIGTNINMMIIICHSILGTGGRGLLERRKKFRIYVNCDTINLIGNKTVLLFCAHIQRRVPFLGVVTIHEEYCSYCTDMKI